MYVQYVCRYAFIYLFVFNIFNEHFGAIITP